MLQSNKRLFNCKLKHGGVVIKDKAKFNQPYLLHLSMCIFVIFLGFLVDTPQEIMYGFSRIVRSTSVLNTDYTVIGGLGATLINVGLCGSLVLAIYYFNDLKLNGSLLMAFWSVFGFAFFGKNIVNITPILLGGFIYAKLKKEPFARYSLVTILATTLAPVVSSVANFYLVDNLYLSLFFALAMGVVVGLTMPAISNYTMKAHSGFNLYNIGFAGGIMGIFLVGFFDVHHITFPLKEYWGTQYGGVLSLLVIAFCLELIIMGIKTSENPKKDLKQIWKSKGRLVSDFYLMYGNSTFINMGINGLMILLLVVLMGADVNGATVAGIFTTIGFGAFGKHHRNMLPVLIGAVLMGGFTSAGLENHTVILSIIFSTALAPIAGTFGRLAGAIAGMMHVLMASSIAMIHGGINLYNYGFAAGMVCIILIPILTDMKKD